MLVMGMLLEELGWDTWVFLLRFEGVVEEEEGRAKGGCVRCWDFVAFFVVLLLLFGMVGWIWETWWGIANIVVVKMA